MKRCSIAWTLGQLTLAAWILTGWQNTAAQSATVIRVDPSAGHLPISPLIYGTNHRFPDNGFGMWDPNRAVAVPAFDAVYDDIGCKAIRYPGGTMANLFDWKKAIGPVQERAVSRADGEGNISKPERVTFGLDECLRWAEKHGTEVVYMYNMANGSAQDAADLIEYLNAPLGANPNGGTAWAEVRAKNGHPAPYNIRYFEIGNEMYLKNQFFWLKDAGPNKPTDLWKRYWATEPYDVFKGYAFGCADQQGVKHDGFIRYYPAMKAVDPRVQIFSCMGFPAFVDLMGADHPYDGLVMHPYAHLKGNLSALDYHDKAMQSAQELSGYVMKLQNYMRAKVGGPRAQAMSVVVTEYGLEHKNKNPPTRDYLISVDHALHVAEMLMNFMRLGMPHSEKMCTLENHGSGQGVFGPAPTFYATPVALAFKLFTRHFGSQLVASTIQNNPVKKVYDGTILKKIEAVASTDPQGKVYLVVLNRDGTDAVTANITIAHGTARQASIWTLSGDTFTAANTEREPSKVKIAESFKNISGAAWAYTFPPHSLTSIRFDQ